MNKARLLACTFIVSTAISTPAWAQDTDNGGALNSNEIVVTAQRREQTVQDVPLAVTAVGGEQLEQQGVRNIDNLGQTAPSLSITTGGGGTQVFMRGIGSTNTNAEGDGAVAVHLDGIYLARANALDAQFYDISRVEVVRGPQGTLYGRNATAGAINIITNAPKFQYEGAASIEYGNYDTLITSGMVNAPVSDTLAIRGAFQSARHDGYLKVIDGVDSRPGNDRDDQDNISGRLQLLFKPSDKFKATLRGDITHQGGAGPSTVPYPLLSENPYDIYANLNVSRDNTIFGGSLEMEYDFGFATLTYLGGYRELQLKSYTEGLQPDSHRPGFVDNNQKSWSNELRLSGGSDKLEWVAGAFLFNEKSTTDFRLRLASGLDLTFIQNPIKADSMAFFGQATYSLTDALRVTGGLRYTEDNKSRNGGTYLTTPEGAIVTQIAVNLADASWSSTDWKAGVEFDAGPDSLLYAQVATAYKAGGYFDGLPPNTYDPEEIISYEVGTKNQFFDRRLQLNISAFYSDYSNLQVSAVETIAGEAALVTRNAGKASIYGVELETAFDFTPSDRVDFNGSWLHARYDEFVLPMGDPFVNNDANAGLVRCYQADYSQPGPRKGDFSGCSLARTPEWSFTAGYSHNFELANGGSIVARAQTHFESAKELEFHGFETNHQGSFTKTDLSVTYVSPDDWTLQAYVRNLEDKAVRTNANSNAQSGNALIGDSNYAAPRLYGVRFSANF